jgi:hypothetical protein
MAQQCRGAVEHEHCTPRLWFVVTRPAPVLLVMAAGGCVLTSSIWSEDQVTGSFSVRALWARSSCCSDARRLHASGREPAGASNGREV